MHLGLESLLDFYREHQADSSLVLGTIVATNGSTYRKAGAMMLIAQDGTHRGLISGGCLESDLAQHALQVFQTSKPQLVNYDLSAGDDLIWGLGIGCEGSIQLLLQPLNQSNGFGFLETLDQLLSRRCTSWLSLVTQSTDHDIAIGSFTLTTDNQRVGHPDLHQILFDDYKFDDPETNCTSSDASSNEQAAINIPHDDKIQRYYLRNIETRSGEITVLQLVVTPPTALLVCGAGIDALPLARLATELGWYCQIVDHRAGFADSSKFPTTCVVTHLQPESLASQIDLGQIDAVVIMSHNLEHDRSYLKGLVTTQQSAFKGQYIGLLVPQARRDRLLKEAGIETDQVPYVHGPAGLDIGAELPESIALSIIAEIHAVLNRRQGGELSFETSNQTPSPSRANVG